MHPEEADATSGMLCAVIETLDFYNAEARRTEIGIYTAAYLAKHLAADPDAVLVAEQDAAIIGFCISRFDDGPCWLSWFGATLGHSGQGVGTALLNALHTARRATGIHKIWCDSRTANVASRACLARAGYREICTITDHWYRQDYVLLECFL
jgi:RimJ/RimL family protein N-acetyltransferase